MVWEILTKAISAQTHNMAFAAKGQMTSHIGEGGA